MTNFGRTVSLHQGYPVAPCIPPETEANPVQRLFCQLNDGLLVMFRYFSFVRCPCNSLLWQRQLNLCIYTIIIIIIIRVIIVRVLRRLTSPQCREMSLVAPSNRRILFSDRPEFFLLKRFGCAAISAKTLTCSFSVTIHTMLRDAAAVNRTDWSSKIDVVFSFGSWSIFIRTDGVVRRNTRNSTIADKPRDAFRGQSWSPNMVPFDMLGTIGFPISVL